MSIPVFINKWIWFVVMTIFGVLPITNSITNSSCDDLCGSDRVVVNDDNIKDKVVNTIGTGQINCFDTSKVTNMESMFDGWYNDIFEDFNEDISCWDTSGVTTMSVSR